MTDKAADHSPISIPAGSYDAQELQKLTDKAAEASESQRQKLINEDLVKLSGVSDVVPHAQPGFKAVERETVLSEGDEDGVGEVKIVETIQVYDPKQDKADAKALEESGKPSAPVVPAPSRATTKEGGE